MSKLNAKLKQVAKPNFVFIDEAAKSSKEKRKQIRSQAKRYAIAETSKRPRKIRFVNLQSEQSSHAATEIKHEPESEESNQSLVAIQEPVIIPDLPKKGYAATRIDYGFDIFLLSGLASVHIGKDASLPMRYARLGDWLTGFRESSYLDCVPTYYDSSSLVQSVVNCTMAQYKQAMCPEAGITAQMILKLYGQALRDLQTALNDDNRRLQPDVLLAAAVMQLFELLQNDNSGRWSYHTLGVMHLMQMRDPLSLSPVEMSILQAQIGPIINECYLRQIDCFLEDPRWKPIITRVYRGNTFAADLLLHQAKLPRFMRIAKDFITGERPGNHLDKLRVLNELHDEKEFTYAWEEELEKHKQRNTALLNLHELPCAVWATQINLNRNMIALDPLAEEARILEEEVLLLANKIFDWWITSSQLRTEREDRMYTYPVPTAQCAVQTGYEWQCAIRGLPDFINSERGVISRGVFETYTNAIRAKKPTRKHAYLKAA